MGRDLVETLMGAIVLLVAASFVFISYKSGNIATTSNGYKIKAKFTQVGSLSVGSDVRVGGIKIGTVSDQYLDPETYKAVVEFAIKDRVQLPKDTIASVVGDGLLGGKYIELEPGGEERILKNGDTIKYTQDAVSFEDLIAKLAFGSVSKPSSE